MNNTEERLSSYSTFFKLYLSLGVAFAGLITILILSLTSGFNNQMIPILLIVLVLITASFYKLIFSADAYLDGNELILRKKFRPLKRYPFNKIHTVKATVSRNTENITLKMENENGNIEKYMIQAFAAPQEAGMDRVSDLLLDLRNGIGR